MSTDFSRSPLATKEGWNAFVSGASLPEPPRLLAAADLERLEPDERELYDCARQDYHSELTLVAPPTSSRSPGPGSGWSPATGASSSAARG